MTRGETSVVRPMLLLIRPRVNRLLIGFITTLPTTMLCHQGAHMRIAATYACSSIASQPRLWPTVVGLHGRSATRSTAAVLSHSSCWGPAAPVHRRWCVLVLAGAHSYFAPYLPAHGRPFLAHLLSSSLCIHIHLPKHARAGPSPHSMDTALSSPDHAHT